MKRRFRHTLAGIALLFAPVPGHAVQTEAAIPNDLQALAKTLAKTLSTACPVATYADERAFQACAQALRKVTLPFQPDIAWGADQPDKEIKKKALTRLDSHLFATLYLPLFTFSGRWSLDQDMPSQTPIIRIEAYFRNALPAGDFPYPFWHSSDKWQAYEHANEIRFYIDPTAQAFIITRDAAGNEQRRGPYPAVTTPAFDGSWTWRDAKGALQPKVSLFANRYSQTNPYLPKLDSAYRAFALRMRANTCLECHTPANKASSSRLVLLQTPLHAAGEIDNVINALRSKEMPQDDIGLRRDIPGQTRAAILNSAVKFRNQLTRAEKWEANQTR